MLFCELVHRGDLFAPRSGQAAREGIVEYRVWPLRLERAVDGHPERGVGDAANQRVGGIIHGPRRVKMERETGFEPATSTLARSHSTTELFPLAGTLMIPSRRLVNQPALPDSRPWRPQRRRIL